MRLKEKKLLQKFAATLKKFSAQGAKKVEYGKKLHLSHWNHPNSPYSLNFFQRKETKLF